MDIGDQLAETTDMEIIDFDQNGVADTVGIDENGNGELDQFALIDDATGNYVLHSKGDDGSSVTLLYDASGEVIEATFGAASGELTEMSGNGLDEFLAQFGELTGTEVPLEVPLAPTPQPLVDDPAAPAVDEGSPLGKPIGDTLLYEPPAEGDVDVEPVPDRIDGSIPDSVPEVADPYADVSEAPENDGPIMIDPDPGLVAQVPIDPSDPGYISTEDVVTSPVYTEWQANIVGDVSDAQFWFQQNGAYTCGPSSATQIIEDFTGADLPEEASVEAWARENALMSETGMTPEALSTTLDYWGVPSTTQVNQDWEDIVGYLEEGRSVVMFVDSSDYWPNGVDEVENSDQDTVNHFTRIVGINLDTQTAILSDSAGAEGQMYEVPIPTLEEAWNDVTATNLADGTPIRDHELVVSDTVDPTQGEVDPTGEVVDDTDRDLAAGVGIEPPDVQIGDGDRPVAGLVEEPALLTEPADAQDGIVDSAVDTVTDFFSNPAGFVVFPVIFAASRVAAAAASRRR